VTSEGPIRPKDRDAVLQSLRAGVVPRRGQHLIQVGRQAEIKTLLDDIHRVSDGGSAFRLIIGSYGSGKSFFLSLVRAVAMERKLVTAHADLTPDRRLQSAGGHARSLYQELMRSLATRTKPDGGALAAVMERFVTAAISDAQQRGVSPSVVIQERLHALSESVGGFDFAAVVENYWRAHDTGNDTLKSDAVRWMRGEFTTKVDARKALGVRRIVEDATVYDDLKLMGRFTRLAGFGGLFVCLDELVNLFKMTNSRARSNNYEQVLRILNDAMQGSVEGLGFVLGGTPEFLTDSRRGLYSYAALQSRLAENTFATGDLVDNSGPVLRLASLTQEDVYVLLGKLRHVYSSGDSSKYLLPDEALKGFMDHCFERVGEAYFRTPRNTIKEFVHLLAILEQNPGTSWTEFLRNVQVQIDSNPDKAPLPEDAEDDGDGTGGSESAPTSGSTTTERPTSGDDDLSSFRL